MFTFEFATNTGMKTKLILFYACELSTLCLFNHTKAKHAFCILLQVFRKAWLAQQIDCSALTGNMLEMSFSNKHTMIIAKSLTKA